MAAKFFEPKPNPFMIGLTQTVGGLLAKLFYQLKVHTSQSEVESLKTLKTKRVIYMVNHPTFNDPIPVMLLSGRVGKGFYYLASIEQFSGILGWYFQRIGTYSVRRGQSDRPSIKQTLELLSQPGTHLVIFPEGGCSFQNDTVMPFRPGAIQIGFQAMQRSQKKGAEVFDCYVVPLALRYRYTADPLPIIQTTLENLEEQLSLSPQTSSSDYERLRAIAARVLSGIEAEYGITELEGEANLTPRIEALRQRILFDCESALSINANQLAAARERTYQIEKKLADQSLVPRTLSREFIQRSIFRLFNFNAIYDGYVAETQSPERFLDTLTRLEREVFEVDRPPAKGERVVEVSVGKPLNLKDEYENYRCDRAKTIDRLTQQVQDQVQAQVDRLAQVPNA